MNRIVVVDPGHGGSDVGAVALDRAEEKTLALRYGAALATALRAHGVRVEMTRTGDTYPALSARARVANELDAALFVSVHFNASSNPHARGPWTIHAASSTAGRAVAARVQAAQATVMGGDATAYYPDESGWVGGRRLAVLRQTRMPAVLLEVGFITNEHDLAIIHSVTTERAWASRVAAAIALHLGIVPPVEDPFADVQWPTPELSAPTPAPPRAPTERLRLEPIEVPTSVPATVSGWIGTYGWAREVAENIGVEAYARRATGTERLVRDALDRLMPVVAQVIPPWLLAIVWPFVERAAYRVAGRG